MTVHAANVSDAGVLATLHAVLFPDGPWDEAFWRDVLNRPTDRAILIGTPPRGLALIRAAAGEAELLTVGTTTQRRGDGTALVKAAAEAALDLGAERLFLEVSARNRGALKLYGRLGFVRLALRPAYYHDGSDAEVMALELHPQED